MTDEPIEDKEKEAPDGAVEAAQAKGLSAMFEASIPKEALDMMRETEEESVQFLYHGSKKRLPKLRKKKAQAPPGRPSEESLDAIYLTPDFLFALACAARPPGTSHIDMIKRTIRFEQPDQFDPEETIYIYCVNPTKIPADKKIAIDPWQVAATVDEIAPDKTIVYRSSELLKHYRVEK